MKCCLCDQKKAKRQCPAKHALICPQCCGEKRMLDIDCPESCEFLIAGRERDAQEYARHIRSLDPAAQQRSKRIFLEHQDALAYLEYTIAHERLMSRGLTDKDVEQAVEILLSTYRTEDKGVLYETTSEDLRIDSMRRELRTVIESLRNPEGKEQKGIVDPKISRLTLRAAIDCLEYIRSLILAFREDRHSSTGYVNFLARITPRGESHSSLIMP